MTIEKDLSRIMKTADANQITRRQLIDKLIELDRIIQQLLPELFYENPNHRFFDHFDEKTLSAMRTNNIIRRGMK
jgi:hypothetical protein